jgi:lipopolysaccharide/colanic/teichoic acid biosynthesis glycosyltransferase
MIRILDLIISILIIVFLIPIILVIIFLIFLQDFRSPIYISERIGKNFKTFKLYKIRTMKINNKSKSIRTTRDNDSRITKLGRVIRDYKIDEVLQFINVLKNDMSIVGPRPNVMEEIKKYSKKEMQLLNIKPGITDLASITLVKMSKLFSKKLNSDVNKEYFRKIKPLKNKLALIWLKKPSIQLYFTILTLTPISIFFPRFSNREIEKLTKEYNPKLSRRIKDLIC